MDKARFAPLLVVVALLAGVAAHAQEPVGGDIVLRVGEAEVTAEEFETRFDIALRGLAAQQGLPLTPELRAQLDPLAPQFLQQRAGEVALLEEARARGIEVADEEVDARVEQIRAGIPDEAGFQQLLEASGIGSEEMLRTLVREDALIGQLQDEIEAGQEVPEEEIRAAYDEDPARFEVGETVCARHILVPTEEEARTALDEIEGGTSFADVAAERGTDGTATRGGELGCFGRGQMVPAFEEAVFDPEAELGVPFGPVESQFGYHVVQVDEREEARTLPYEEVREDLRATLVEQSVQDELVGIIEGAGIETFPENLPTPPAPEAPQDGAPQDGAPQAPPAPEEAPAAPEGEEAPAQEAPAQQAPEEAPAAPDAAD